jgi:hypothetical protein
MLLLSMNSIQYRSYSMGEVYKTRRDTSVVFCGTICFPELLRALQVI